MTPESLSVVIPHHGAAQQTVRLIEQLKAQTGEVELQLIVVDDASPEAFPHLAGVEVVRRERNGGFAAAVNTGVGLVSGDTMLILNSDVSVQPDFVTALLEGAAPLWPAVVTTRVVESFGERCMGHTWPTTSAVVLEHLLPLARFHGTTWFEHRTSNLVESIGIESPLAVDWVTGICMLMPTSDVKAVRGLDERYFMNCEEVDLQKRLHDERGLQAVVLPYPIIEHVGGGSSPSEKRADWVLDARMRYAEKWEGAGRLRAGLVAAAGTNLVWNTGRRLLGRRVTPVETFVAEIGRLEHAWRTRR